MAPEPLVDQPAVEAALLRPLTFAEAQYIGTLCDQASARLRSRLPSVDARIALWGANPQPPNAIDPDTVTSVLADVIAGKIVNPSGATSSSSTEGPYSTSNSWSSNGTQFGRGGQIVITDDDLAQLIPSVGVGVPRTLWTTSA